jgi:hypothetical protein
MGAVVKRLQGMTSKGTKRDFGWNMVTVIFF